MTIFMDGRGTLARRSGEALEKLEGGSNSHASGDAERGQAEALLPPRHLVKERHHDARPGRADGMAERNRAAVDVHTLFRDAELREAGEDLRGEGLVQLD